MKNRHRQSAEKHREERRDHPLGLEDRIPDARLLHRLAPVGEHQDADHREEVERHLPQRAVALSSSSPMNTSCGLRRLRPLLLQEDQVHQQADDHAEDHRADRPRHAQLPAQHPRRQHDRQHVDRRAGVEERDGRAEPRAAHVDAAEEGQHRAGADGQDRAGDRRHAVGQGLVRLRPEVLHHRVLADEHADGAGDEERGHQAEQHMLPRVPLRPA